MSQDLPLSPVSQRNIVINLIEDDENHNVDEINNDDSRNDQDDENEDEVVEVDVIADVQHEGDDAIVEEERDEPEKEKKEELVKSGNSNDSNFDSCSICFDPFANSGDHRLACLKCGHLFGYHCIVKWLNGRRGSAAKCPQCNAFARRADIRVLFAKSIKVIDTTERDRAIDDYKHERKRRLEVEQEYHAAAKECERLRALVDSCNTNPQQQKQEPTSSKANLYDISPNKKSKITSCYHKRTTVPISQQGDCRVMTYDTCKGTLVVSKPSPNQLFPGYGIVKISSIDVRNPFFLKLHSKDIRDLKFNQRGDGLLLSASLDKTLKVTSITTDNVVQTYTCSTPVWSCAWNTTDTNYIYGGLSNGSCLVFDMRNTTEHFETIQAGDCPVMSLSFVPYSQSSTLKATGIIAGTLKGCCFIDNPDASQFIPYQLQLPEGSCTSVSFDAISRHCLVTYRPSLSHPRTRHIVMELSLEESDRGRACNHNILQNFYGSNVHKLLSRSLIYSHPTDYGKSIVSAADESSKEIKLWSTHPDTELQTLPPLTLQPLDFTVLNVSGNIHYLAALTTRDLVYYQWH